MLDKDDIVQLGDRVWIFYDDLEQVEGIVSHVHNRADGTISVRIHRSQLTPKQLSTFFVEMGGFAPLMLKSDEWELRRGEQ